jgi:hypothetical protein
MKHDIFLEKLQEQAKLQSKLNEHRIFPRQLDNITSFIGNYPWQTLLVISFLSAALWQVFG